MKRFINRRTVAWTLYYTGILYLIGMLARWIGENTPLFLMGHRVLPDNNRADTLDDIDRMAHLSGHAITATDLKRRLKFVRRLRPAGDPSELTSGMPRNKAFYLTFDDGYRDNITIAAPILQKLGIKAVIFLIGDMVKNPNILPWWDSWGADALRVSRNDDDAVSAYGKRCLEQKNISRGLRCDSTPVYEENNRHCLYLSERDIKQENQTFYFACHTASHANLTLLNDAEISTEIEEGIATIRDAPNYLPLLAFPFGSYNERVLSYLQGDSDITLAFATWRGIHKNRYCVSRVNLNTSPYYLFVAECLGVFRFFR